LATGTARTSPRKRNESSSESKHDDRSPRTSHNPHTRTAVGQMDHHLLSVGDGSVSRTHHVLLMRQLLKPLSYPAMFMGCAHEESNLAPPASHTGALSS
jgi:hypothetical protein